MTFGEPDEGKLGLGNDSGDHFRPKEVEGIEGKVTWVACGGAHTVAVTGMLAFLTACDCPQIYCMFLDLF